MSVAKEIVIEENGQEVAQWVEAEDIEPGQKLRYTVRYINVGDEPATEVRIENPIPTSRSMYRIPPLVKAQPLCSQPTEARTTGRQRK